MAGDPGHVAQRVGDMITDVIGIALGIATAVALAAGEEVMNLIDRWRGGDDE